jgi:hypothetical protein
VSRASSEVLVALHVRNIRSALLPTLGRNLLQLLANFDLFFVQRLYPIVGRDICLLSEKVFTVLLFGLCKFGPVGPCRPRLCERESTAAVKPHDSQLSQLGNCPVLLSSFTMQPLALTLLPTVASTTTSCMRTKYLPIFTCRSLSGLPHVEKVEAKFFKCEQV